MLRIPDRGMVRSVNKHNSSLSVVSDWIEASLLFEENCEKVSRSDVIDQLIDSEVYVKQDFADQFLIDVWKELSRRGRRLGRSCPFAIVGKVITRKKGWRQVPAYAYCMALSMVDLYHNDWLGPMGVSHAEQGELFERIAESSLATMGWSVLRTGWASGQSNVKLPKVVESVSAHLAESRINEAVVIEYKDYNEHGLDLVISRPFHEDSRGGKPAFLVQCASGLDETSKRKTPDISTWSKLIGFSSNPVRAFVVPFSYEENAFFRLCNDVDGMVLDRYRLLSAGRNGKGWLAADLKARIIGTLETRLQGVDRLRAS
jgi:hypothetical protein